MKTIQKLLCFFFNCDWRYNFSTIPDKKICTCCKTRKSFDFNSFEWNKTFKDWRSDDELINKWVKLS